MKLIAFKAFVHLSSDFTRSPFMTPDKPRWKRSRDGMIAGVAAGLADELGFEPWIIRLFFVALTVLGGYGLFIYIALALSLPAEHKLENANRPLFLGVCKRLAIRADIELGLMRTIWSLMLLHSCGAAIFIYVAAYFLMPKMEKPASTESGPAHRGTY